ncbi:MAG: hypothetical protein RIT14_1530 [Pseudomonadota bacterium]|jgi:UDP-glucose 4-epimerase
MTEGLQIVITGAGGFIGSHLVEAALAAGHRVTALLRYGSQGSIGNLARIGAQDPSRLRLVFGDVRDAGQMQALLDGADRLIHAAALIGIPYSYAAPESYFATNVDGTLTLLQAARRAGLARMVFVSTSEVYGSAQRPLIAEDHPLAAQSPYAASKIAAEAACTAWANAFGLPVTVIRPFNTFGPGQSLRAVIPTILAQALSGGPVQIGSTWPERDFTFVTDTAEALLLAATHPGLGTGPYNLGTGRSVSIGAVIEAAASLVGHPLDVVTDPARIRPAASEVVRLTADNARFRAATGWTPRIDLTEGLRRTLSALHSLPDPPQGYRT